MKSAHVGLFLLAALAHPAQAQADCDPLVLECRRQFVRANLPDVHRPDPDDPHDAELQQELERLLRALTKKIPLKEKETHDALADADQGFVFDPLSLDSWLRRSRHEKEFDQGNYDRALRSVAAVRNEKFEIANRAIAVAIELYHLVPEITAPQDNPHTPIHAPVTNWSPRFMDSRHYDRTKHDWVTDTDDYGWSEKNDGRIRIFEKSFESPAQLASSLLHETSHWLERNDMGRPFTEQERYLSEVLAYEVTLEQARNLGLDERQISWYKHNQAQYQYQADHPELYSHKPANWLPLYGDKPLGGAADADSGRADEIDAVVERTVRQRRAEADRRKELAAAHKDAARGIAGLAQRACDDPEEIEQADIDALPTSDSGVDDFGEPASGLGACAREVELKLRSVLAFGERPSLAQLRNRMNPVAAAPPKPLARAEMALSEALPNLARLACDKPDELTPQTFDFYLPSHAVRAGQIGDCAPLCRGLSSCAQTVLRKLCGWSSSSYSLDRDFLLPLAARVRNEPAPEPPASQEPIIPDPPERKKNDPNCGRDPGSPSWCVP